MDGTAAPGPALARAPAIAAEGLVKHYGEVKALDGLDLERRRGHGARPARARTVPARPPRSGC